MQTILIALAVVVGVGRIAGLLSARMKLAPVVGEILAGILLANLPFFPLGKELASNGFLQHLAEVGIVLLLFSAGLESTLTDLAKVGGRALTVALVGVVAPFVLALGAFKLGILEAGALSGSSRLVIAIFVGATLTATSVGITARILRESGKLGTRTAQIILNAAVIDDVLGLLVLAGVTSYVTLGAVSYADLSSIGLKALAFFVIAIPLGYLTFPPLVRKLRAPQSLMALGLCACFIYAGAGMAAGLAPIVGAFFAGLLLDDPKDGMRKRLEPIIEFLSPIFFVFIGASIRFDSLTGGGADALRDILVLGLLAVAGKLVCGLVAGKGTDRLAVGLGMIPRGEVGLIFATTGHKMGVVSDRLFAVLVVVILLSTVIPAVLLEKRLKK